MNSESFNPVGLKEKDKQKNATVKLEWIFGIRNDISPNIFMLDSDTLVYPASHYIVIFNHTRKLPFNQIQQFIYGTPHSKGFITLNISNIHKKYIALAEEMNDGVSISIYTLLNSMGNWNLPQKVLSLSLYDIRITKVYHLAFSLREQAHNYFAIIGFTDEPSLILWKWENENLKDRLVFASLKFPTFNYKYLQISFSVFKNDNFCIISDKFVVYYSINNKSVNPQHSFFLDDPLYKHYGTSIISHCWFYDGNFAICTDNSILIFDLSLKIVQHIDTVQEKAGLKSYITAILPLMDTFIAAGKNCRFEIYERKSEIYEKIAEKKNFDYNVNVTDKFEKAVSSEKLSEMSNQERNFDFVALTCPTNSTEQYVIATTSLNDIIQINTNIKDLDKQISKHLIAPFHSDSIEGMDICINKPYLITCSLDKTLRIWDYKKRILSLCKNFDEEMYSVAYHPNGMHAIVSFQDKIIPMHIYYDEIANMTQNVIPLKSNTKSKDVKFSNGGQFFAFDSGNRVEVWDFLNMVIYSPNNNPCKKQFGSNKVSD